MTKYIFIGLLLMTIAATTYAQSEKKDTVVLSVYNNNQRFMLYPMPFGKDRPDNDFTADMVIAADTINILETSTKKDTSGKFPQRWMVKRSCGKLPNNVKDKVALLYLNKDCDISTQVLNAQTAGAIAVIVIDPTDNKDSVALPKKSLTVQYENDSKVTIPCFTVRKSIGEKLTQMLPSLMGIQRPKTSAVVQSLQQVPITTLPTVEVQKTKADSIANTLIKDTEKALTTEPFTRIGWIISPNPAHGEAVLQYNFSQVATIQVEVFNEAGQLVTNYHLPNNPTGTLNMDVSGWVSGIYSVRLVNGELKEVKRLVAAH